MANTKFQIKRSVVPGKSPLPGDLEIGELAINLSDAKIFSKHSLGNIVVLSDYELSNLAYNTANSAWTKANAAYDFANTRYSSNGGIIYGNVDINGSLSISSNTLVANLNSDLLDSYHASTSNTANTVVVRDANSFIYLDGIHMSSPDGMKRIAWNNTYSTYDMQLLDGVTLQVGQESHVYGRATENIYNGQVVMFAGAQGDGLLLRVANSQISGFEPKWIVGVATQNILENEWGYVTWFGKVNDVDTYNYTLGDILYLDNSVAGGLSNTRPIAPDHAITLAAVVRKSNSPSSNNGILMVRPDFGESLDELHDVRILNASANDVLIYSSANTRWENKSQSDIISGDSDKLDGQHGSYYTGYTDTANTNNIIYTNNAISSNVAIIQGVNNTQNTNISNLSTWLSSNNTLQSGINATQNTIITAAFNAANTANVNAANASFLTTGTIPGDRGVTAGSATSSFVEYNGTAKTSGQFDGGSTDPTNITRLNYDGNFYATTFYGAATGLTGTASNLTANVATYEVINNATSGIYYPQMVSGTSGNLAGYANNAFAFDATNGRFGIGTTSPSTKFHIVNNSVPAVIINAGGGTLPSSTAALNVWTSAFGTPTLASFSSSDGYGSNKGGFSFSDTQSSGDWFAGRFQMYQSYGAANEIMSVLSAENSSWSGMLFTVQTGGNSALTTSPSFIWKNYTTEQMRLSSSGSLGIGTNNPVYKLDVNGTAKATTLNLTENTASTNTTTGTLIVTGGVGVSGNVNATTFYGAGTGLTGSATNLTANVATYEVINNATSGTYYPQMVSGTSGNLAGYANNAFAFDATNGRFGIGTNNPVYAIDILSSQGIIQAKASLSSGAAAGLFWNGVNKFAIFGMESTSGGTILTGSSGNSAVFGTSTGGGPIELFTNNSKKVIVDTSGNVIIGLPSTTYKLDVNGIAKANSLVLTANTASTNTTSGTLIVTGGVGISGALNATTKSFDIVHPSDSNKRLRYGSLESPYHGVRLTGTGTVYKGTGTVTLPYYIRDLIQEEEINIQITNIKHGNIIWIEDINLSENNFTVGSECNDELEFYWSFTGIRKDVDCLMVEY